MKKVEIFLSDELHHEFMKLNQQEKEYILSRKTTLWLKEYNIKNEQGLPIDFHDHLYLYDIYNDFSPKQVIYKAAQIGFSTTAILKTLWAAKYKKLDIIYTLPTVQDSRDFVGGKVNRIIAQNPILQGMVRDKDTVDQKQVDQNLIYYRGTWTEKAAIMVTSDLNVYDEVDRSKQDIIDQYSSRLQHSKHKMEWFFSNPSVPGNGVSRFWDRSDQKHWFVTCQHCNKKQYLNWPESIDLKTKQFVCKQCHKPIERKVGEWVRKYKDKEYSGYWISLLMAPWVTAEEIISYSQTKSEEFFYNFVLGLPYVGKGNVVTPNVIYRNLTNEIIQPEDEKNERVVIGVDTGTTIYYVVGNDKGLFYYGSCTDYDEIEKLINRYKRSIVVFDQGGDLIAPRKLREKYPGRIFLCHYSVDRKTMQLVRWGKDKELGNVIADRNRMIQLVIDEFIDKRIQLQGTEHDWYDYYLHWKNIYKTKELNSLGVEESRWERSSDDHWVHATVYWRVGMDRFGMGQGQVMGSGQWIKDLPLSPTVVNDRMPIMPRTKTRGGDWRNV